MVKLLIFSRISFQHLLAITGGMGLPNRRIGIGVGRVGFLMAWSRDGSANLLAGADRVGRKRKWEGPVTKNMGVTKLL